MKYTKILGKFFELSPEGEAAIAATIEESRATVYLGTDKEVKAYLAEQDKPIVPTQVTMRQGKEALIRQGKIAGVQAAIDGIKDATERAVAQNFWDNSNAFDRNNSTLIALSSALGMTTKDLDALFIYAATL